MAGARSAFQSIYLIGNLGRRELGRRESKNIIMFQNVSTYPKCDMHVELLFWEAELFAFS